MKKRIGDVARAAGIGVETVRFYQRAGVLDEPEKPLRGWRSYGPALQRQLLYVRMAREMGQSIGDIAVVKKSVADGRGRFCRDVRKTVEQRLATIDAQIAELQQARADLSNWLAGCRKQPARAECPLYR